MKSAYIKNRRGTIAALLAVLMAPLLMLLALSVDYGFLCYVKTEQQRAADQSVLAAALELVPDDWGAQNIPAVRAMLRTSVQKNLGDGFEVEDADIVIGRYDPDTIYSDLQILDTGIFDTVQVTLRRNDVANQSISLYFARLFDHDRADLQVTATAVIQKARYLGPGTGVLPMGVEQEVWESLTLGDEISVYGDGQIKDSNGQTVPGNWGTVDIGDGSNSTADIRNQIINGLSQDDLDALHEDGIIDSPDYINTAQEITLEGDPGFSAGMKHAMWEVEGQTRFIPIYDQVSGNGNNASYEIVKWATVRLIDFRFAGSKNSFIEVRKSYIYDQALLPIRNLSDQSDAIENAYTYPALVQ